MTDFPMLRGLDDQERRRLVAAATPRRFAAREVVDRGLAAAAVDLQRV